jgi:uncharacterized protein (DUF58 family)
MASPPNTSSNTLTPPAISAAAIKHKRFGAAFGPRFFLLLAIGLLWLGPAAIHPIFLFGMFAWDLLIFAAWWIEFSSLPHPSLITARRTWNAPAVLSTPAEITLELKNRSVRALRADLTDNVPVTLRKELPALQMTVPGGGAASAAYSILPMKRGDVDMGILYMRYGGLFRLAERWAAVEISQKVRVYPNLEAARRSIYMIRSRRLTQAQRQSRGRGQGREFESLREYRQGDEFRSICWSASARRSKLITRQFQTERSQSVWLVLDAGRLMRAKISGLSKLDYAAAAALSLAEAALASGDRVGLMSYGRAVSQRLLPNRGGLHLRMIMDGLARVDEEQAESNPLRAATLLLSTQSRRGLVVWITDLAETAVTPEVLDAARLLLKRHVVVLLVIGQPDLKDLASRNPDSIPTLYLTAAAQETAHRREILLASLRRNGALAIETDHAGAAAAAVNSYLEVKERNLI